VEAGGVEVSSLSWWAVSKSIWRSLRLLTASLRALAKGDIGSSLSLLDTPEACFRSSGGVAGRLPPEGFPL
jgi:hypothetical protein